MKEERANDNGAMRSSLLGNILIMITLDMIYILCCYPSVFLFQNSCMLNLPCNFVVVYCYTFVVS